MGINDVINSLILALHDIFGDEYTYYPENVGQGMKLPCFFVQYVSGNEEHLVGKRYLSKTHFVVHGHVEEGEASKTILNDMAVALYDIEYLRLKNDDIIRLNNRKTQIQDYDVIYDFDINIHLIKEQQEDTENMGNISLKEGVKKYG